MGRDPASQEVQMNTPDPYLLAAFLTDAELRRLEVEAGDDPRARDSIQASFRIRAAAEDGIRLQQGDLTDAVLILAALPAGEGAVWKHRLRERILADPEAAARLASLEAGARRLEEESDAGRHFERITGHRVEGNAWSTGSRAWLSAAVLVLLVLSHGLWSRVQEDPLKRMVWSELRSEQMTFRSAVAPSEELSQARIEAVGSRSSVLGLWPTYDEARLSEASTMLMGRTDPVARIEQARIQVLMGNPEGARHTLLGIQTEGMVARGRDRLLDLIERHAGPFPQGA